MASLMATLGTVLVWLLFLAGGAGLGFGAYMLWERISQNQGSSAAKGKKGKAAAKSAEEATGFLAQIKAKLDGLLKANTLADEIAAARAADIHADDDEDLEDDAGLEADDAATDDEDAGLDDESTDLPAPSDRPAPTPTPAPTAPTPAPTAPTPAPTANQPVAAGAPRDATPGPDATPPGPATQPASTRPSHPTPRHRGRPLDTPHAGLAPAIARPVAPSRKAPRATQHDDPAPHPLTPGWARAARRAESTMRANGWKHDAPREGGQAATAEAADAFEEWRRSSESLGKGLGDESGQPRVYPVGASDPDAEAAFAEAAEDDTPDAWSEMLRAAKENPTPQGDEDRSEPARNIVPVGGDDDDLPPTSEGGRRAIPVIPDYEDPEETPLDEHGRRVIRITNDEDEGAPTIPAQSRASPRNETPTPTSRFPAATTRDEPETSTDDPRGAADEDEAWPSHADEEAASLLRDRERTTRFDSHPNEAADEPEPLPSPTPTPGSRGGDASAPPAQRDQEGAGPTPALPTPEPATPRSSEAPPAKEPVTAADEPAAKSSTEATPHTSPSSTTPTRDPTKSTPDTMAGLPQVPVGRRQRPEGATISRAEAIEELNAIYGLTYDEGVALVEAGLWGFENHDEWVRGMRAGSGIPPWLPKHVVDKVLAQPMSTLKGRIDDLRAKRKSLEELETLWGVGPAEAQAIYDAGYQTRAELDEISTQKLSSIKGIGPAIAFQIKASLHGLAPEDAGKKPAEKTA